MFLFSTKALILLQNLYHTDQMLSQVSVAELLLFFTFPVPTFDKLP